MRKVLFIEYISTGRNWLKTTQVIAVLALFLTITNNNYAQSIDSDGDGIINRMDLDDDNDGILDITEGCIIPGVLPDVAGEINSGTDYKTNNAGNRTHKPQNAGNNGQTNDGSTTIDAPSGLSGQVNAVDMSTNISVDYTITRESEHNGFGSTRYSRNQDNGIFLVATQQYSTGPDGTVYNNNDVISYKIALNNTTSGYLSRVTISQNIFCTSRNNEAADWTFSWDGGGNAIYYDDAISTTAPTTTAGGAQNPNGVLYPEGYPATGFDINEREIVGLDTIGAFASNGGFRTYFATNSHTKWKVEFPFGATNIKAIKTTLKDGTANGLSDNPADGISASFPKYGRIGIADASGGVTNYYNGESFTDFITYQIDFVRDTDKDGIANCIDLDSDNDGCPDAWEGAATVNISDIYAEGEGTAADKWRFKGNVNSDGVPVVIAPGQGLGVAQDAASSSCPTVLPIELINFTATPISNEMVKLYWQTATEINNDYFTIERSHNAKDWEVIETLAGAGNSAQLLSYSSFDKMPFNGTSYYRLKQTDFDGKYSYSPIKAVHIKNVEWSKVNVFPNPSQNELTILGNKQEIENYAIYNILGNNVSHKISEIENYENKTRIDLSKLNSGMYFIKTKTSLKKWIKL